MFTVQFASTKHGLRFCSVKQRDGSTRGNRCCLVGVYLDLHPGNFLLELKRFLKYVAIRERNAEYRVQLYYCHVDTCSHQNEQYLTEHAELYYKYVVVRIDKAVYTLTAVLP